MFSLILTGIRNLRGAFLQRRDLVLENLEYDHGARTHLALERDSPVPRPVEHVGQGEAQTFL